jgi:hypothetical protein
VPDFGSAAGTVCQGNDARLSDSRTPTTHTHEASDIAAGTIATARLGSGTASASTFLRGDQNWALPVTFSTAQQQSALRSTIDADDWAGRVYTTGGTVSAATYDAVREFCQTIHAAGMRQLFYRANLFAGSNLAAATVPVWRSIAREGTQYGNALDTNFNFTSGDYSETGSTGGLTGTGNNGAGAGNSKHLRTGLQQATIASSNLHLAAFVFGLNTTSATQQGFVGIRNNTTPQNRWWLEYRQASIFAESGGTVGSMSTPTGNSFVAISRQSSTLLRTYINGSQAGSDLSTDISSSLANRANDWYVFAVNLDGSPAEYCLFRLGFYSIGLSLSDAQQSTLYSALVAFNTAMDRT